VAAGMGRLVSKGGMKREKSGNKTLQVQEQGRKLSHDKALRPVESLPMGNGPEGKSAGGEAN
jgi:hypothetical protein